MCETANIQGTTVAGPNGWEGSENYQWHAEWADVRRWTTDLETQAAALEAQVLTASGDTKATLINQLLTYYWNLEQYGSSKSRPAFHAANFVGGRLTAAGVEARMRGLSSIDLSETENATQFLITQPEQNLAAAYNLIFEGAGARGWMNEAEKTVFVSIVTAAISDQERDQFRKKWNQLSDEAFAAVWDNRISRIQAFIQKFQAQETPETRPRRGNDAIGKVLDLLKIQTDIAGIRTLTQELVDGVFAGESSESETGKKEINEVEYKKIIQETAKEFIQWLKEMGLPDEQIQALKKWQRKRLKRKIGLVDDSSPLNAATSWVDQKISLKSANFWNQSSDPAGTLRLFVWHELVHVLQMLGIRIKADQNNSLAIETHGVLGEFALVVKNPQLLPAFIELLKKRAVTFNVGLQMQEKEGEELNWSAILSQAGMEQASLQKVINSLSIGPIMLQQYWLAVVYLLARIGDGNLENITTRIEAVFRDMIKGNNLDFSTFDSPINAEELRTKINNVLVALKQSAG